MKNPELSPDCVLEPLPDYREYPQAEMVERARAFHAELLRRRTVRDFDTRLVPREVIEACLLAAGTAQTHAGLLVPAAPGAQLYVANISSNTIVKFFFLLRATIRINWLDSH